jgi:hypothetical protein
MNRECGLANARMCMSAVIPAGLASSSCFRHDAGQLCVSWDSVLIAAEPFFKGIFPGGRDSALEHDDDLAQPWIEGSDKGKAPAGASTMHGEPHDLLDLDRVGTSDGEEGLERFGDLDGYVCRA